MLEVHSTFQQCNAVSLCMSVTVVCGIIMRSAKDREQLWHSLFTLGRIYLQHGGMVLCVAQWRHCTSPKTEKTDGGTCYYAICPSGRFVKQKKRERWRAKQKLVSGWGSKRRAGVSAGGDRPLTLRGPGVITPGKVLRLHNHAKSCNLVQVVRKMVRNKWFAVPSIMCELLILVRS